MAEKAVNASPKKTSRNLTAHYSSHLLYETNAAVKLNGIKLAACNPGLSEIDQHEYPNTSTEESAESVHVLPEKLVVPDTMSCGCCQLTFEEREDQKIHYKSDWHRYNIQRKLIGQPFVSEETFEEIAGDVSSISGSDDDEDRQGILADIHEESTSLTPTYSLLQDRKLHKVYFTNDKGELISVYRCLLHHKKDPPEDIAQLIKATSELPKQNKCAVLLISAGHFAGAVFHGKEVFEHKTFHRYTVRAKRGTAQSSRDQKSNAPNSAGARLRRYNEEALSKEVQELLENWKDHLKTCHFVFVRIPINNRGIFYGGKNPILKKDDNRIRIIPFATRRPTFSEVKRVHQMLVSIECYGSDADIGAIAPLSPQRFYSKETEQLELRLPRIRVAKKEKESRSRSGSRRKQSPVHQSNQETEGTENSSEDEEGDVQLVESFETLDLTHLREFEATKKRHKKKKKGKQKENKSCEDSELDEEKLKWRNRIFTSCKTGNVDSLVSTLMAIQERQSDTNEPETLCRISQKNTEKVEKNSCLELSKDAKQENKEDCITQRPVCSEINHESYGNSADFDSTNTSSKIDKGMCSEKTCDLPEKEPVLSELTSLPDIVCDLLNGPIGDNKMTFLHLAAQEGHADVIKTLMIYGADPSIKDGRGKLAYNLAQSECRNTFRRFMAEFPDKYDYGKAQVPSPLTAEMENEKKSKMAEKRKQKRKAANERNKEKKAVEAVVRAENQEKERFMKLSDREKRLIAAERRILEQHNQEGSSKPILSRCFQCGVDITGKVPFEYSDNKFCTTKCLREHRSKPAS